MFSHENPLDILPLSPAIALGLLHTFAVRILLAQCYGPVVSCQAQQQGEDLNKEIMFDVRETKMYSNSTACYQTLEVFSYCCYCCCELSPVPNMELDLH